MVRPDSVGCEHVEHDVGGHAEDSVRGKPFEPRTLFASANLPFDRLGANGIGSGTAGRAERVEVAVPDEPVEDSVLEPVAP